MASETLYEQIANQLFEQIDSGVYSVGDKLPSVRGLSRQMRISISTALDAYRLLEQRDVVMAKPKSGYFVTRRPGAAPEMPSSNKALVAPAWVSQWGRAMHATSLESREDVVSMGRAAPDVTMPTLRPLTRMMAVETRKGETRSLGYGPLQGCTELRVQLARHSREAGLKLSPDDFIVTNGCQEALLCCLRAVTKPGDVIAVETPTYYGILQAIEASGLKVLEIPTRPCRGMSVGALEMALEQWTIGAVLVTPSFNNPLGYVMSDERKQRLAAIAAKHRMPMIEDDIYGDMGYQTQRPLTIKSFDEEGWVMLCSSISKTLAPGLRVGWCVPGRFYDQVEHQKYVASMNTATLPQLAVAEFMAKGNFDRHVNSASEHYRRRRDQMIDLIDCYFPEQTRMTRPEGGMLLWVELPNQISGVELSKLALANHIGISPGPLFSARGRYQNFIRISYSQEVDKRVVDAIRTLGKLAHSLIGVPTEPEKANIEVLV